MKRSLLAAIIAFSASPVFADKLYDKCIDQSDGTNTAWGQCGGDWLKRADGKLNATWKKIYGQADGQTKTDLLAEQRLWNSYKNRPAISMQMAIGEGKAKYCIILAAERA